MFIHTFLGNYVFQELIMVIKTVWFSLRMYLKKKEKYRFKCRNCTEKQEWPCFSIAIFPVKYFTVNGNETLGIKDEISCLFLPAVQCLNLFWLFYIKFIERKISVKLKKQLEGLSCTWWKLSVSMCVSVCMCMKTIKHNLNSRGSIRPLARPRLQKNLGETAVGQRWNMDWSSLRLTVEC